MDNKNTTLPKNIAYVQNLFAKEDELLIKIHQYLLENNMAINISPYEAKILQLIVKIAKVKTIIEIGTLAGYSAIWLARALPADGYIYSFEQNPANAALAERHIAQANLSDKITIIVGAALAKLPTIEQYGPFDMAFIDADKANYCNYLDWCEANIKSGGIIAADNNFLFGNVYGENNHIRPVKESTIKIMQEFNQRLADQTKYDSSIILPTIEGLAVGVRG
ncbi:MAG: O-methyltransferase [Pseudomonadota bacterium]